MFGLSAKSVEDSSLLSQQSTRNNVHPAKLYQIHVSNARAGIYFGSRIQPRSENQKPSLTPAKRFLSPAKRFPVRWFREAPENRIYDKVVSGAGTGPVRREAKWRDGTALENA